ncbi:glutamine synthetase beta-grasp domain-containing protein [Kordiimonas aestuarii]|uniref:glutamine synthetase beta-grasp domain-containing protein n=1 Tax=Kordiimonas aestuarii TaxID=1005925 RepID=UPI0021D03FFF|nr:glutamine synthetase beta-grasp domain-containing protein [Kordiimonas aestuarii]
MSFAEYIWLDGSKPTRQLRSKTRFVRADNASPKAIDFPIWSFDGSSTGQAEGSDSDCLLVPACVVRDPFREGNNYLVLCEVYDAAGKVHESNTRASLRATLKAGAERQRPWAGFEQEYTLFQDERPLGWPVSGEPDAQGPYYCSVGADVAFGRAIAEEHAQKCLDADLLYYGLNAEVMPGQWEFQIGFRGIGNEDPGLLNVADHVWLARWILHRVAEDHGVSVSFANKPVKGDWNGAGMHTNFSTEATRAQEGMKAIEKAVERLGSKHAEHIAIYGDGLAERLTGQHETCSINEFRAGTADRGASIRIPLPVQEKGHGYFEDRRPGANADPYEVAAKIAATVCDIEQAAIEAILQSGNHPESVAA